MNLTNRFFVTLVGVGLGVGFAQADLRIGGSRANTMGGAGLALPVNPTNNLRLNPAMIGFAPGDLSVEIPSLGYQLQGIKIGDLSDYLGSINDGSLDSDKIQELGLKFGRNDIRFGLDGTLGLRMGGFAVTGYAQAEVLAVPNADLKSYNGSSGSLGENPQLDAYGLGYYTLGIGYGRQIPIRDAHLGLGVNVNIIKAYYAHKVAKYDSSTETADVTDGIDIDSGSDTNSKNGVGVDLGLLASSDVLKGTYAGLVVKNFIEPNVKFSQQLPDSTTVAVDNLRPFKRSINAGLGKTLDNGKFLLAADMLDLGNHAGNSSLALGAEYAPLSWFSVGAGYNSRTRFTVGCSIIGINISYSDQEPITFGYLLKF